MNAQRCWFLRAPGAPARRAGSDRGGAASSGRSANRRIGALGPDGVPDRLRAHRHASAVGVDVGGRRPFAAVARRRGSRPGSTTWTSVRKPPGSSSAAANRTSPSGIRSAAVAAASVRGVLGVERPAQGRGEEPRDGSPVVGDLVQPGMLAARHDQRLDGGRSGSPARAGSGRGREALQVAGRHDRVLVAVGEEDRAAIARDRRGRVDVADDVAARPEVDAGREPRERVGDRVGDRQAGRGGTSGG